MIYENPTMEVIVMDNIHTRLVDVSNGYGTEATSVGDDDGFN